MPIIIFTRENKGKQSGLGRYLTSITGPVTLACKHFIKSPPTHSRSVPIRRKKLHRIVSYKPLQKKNTSTGGKYVMS
ncbi:hypothetical protein VTL71DRAFT_345 [Oculimacula yallundae]|uniref:Ribosomal protein L33 n=1 Tax=Oculimacula yallundae TaxID=86028 RepID=A0ABR4CZS8_9HELO